MSSLSPGPHPTPPPAQSARASGTRSERLRRRISLFLLIVFVLAAGAWRYRITRPEYRYTRGEQAIKAGDLDTARQYADRLEASGYPDHANLLRGEVLLRSGAADRAIVYLSRVRAEGPLRRRTDVLTGQCLLTFGSFREAAQVFQAVVSEHPDDVDAHRGLAVIAYDLGQLDEAVESLRRVAELDPVDARPHRLIGLIYKDLSQNPASEEAYREALRRGLSPRVEEEVRVELAAVLTRQGKYAAGIEVLDVLPSGGVEDPAGAAARAECLRGLGRPQEAANVLDAALARQASTPLWRLRGQVYQDQGRLADALPCFERAAELSPADQQSYHLLGQAYAALGRKEDAKRAFDRAAELRRDLDKITALSKEAMAKPWDAAVRLQLAELSDRLGMPQVAAVWRKAAAACVAKGR